MKTKIVVFLASVLMFFGTINTVLATNGYMYLVNVNNVFGSSNKIQFKVVTKRADGVVTKTIETDELKPNEVVNYKLTDFGMDATTMDLYARDLQKSSAYTQCESGFPFFAGVTILAHGWSESQNATCRFVDDEKKSR